MNHHVDRIVPRERAARRAFTLIELLVVITVITVLIAILLPTISRARDVALRVVCASNERQIGISIWAYANDARDTFFATNIQYRGVFNNAGQYFLTPYDNNCGGSYGPTLDVWRDGYDKYMSNSYKKLVEDPGDKKNGHTRADGYPNGYQWRYSYHAMMRDYPYDTWSSWTAPSGQKIYWTAYRSNPHPAKALFATCSQVGLWTAPWPSGFGWGGAAHPSPSFSDRSSPDAVYGWSAFFGTWYMQDFAGQNSLRMDGHVEWIEAKDMPVPINNYGNDGWGGMSNMTALPW